jgi:hypothetical protein
MNWDMVPAIAEIVGVVAVVASLLYVAKQTRVSANAAISNSRSASAVAISEIDRAIAQDSDLAQIVQKSMLPELAEFDRREWFRFMMFARSLVYLYEDQYMQSLTGTTDPERGQIHLAAVIAFKQLPAWRSYWELETRGDTFQQAFVEAVNSGRTTKQISAVVVAGRR